MKNRLIITVVFILCWHAFALAGVAERVYVSTDKDVYVAGETVWCSAFCMDAGTGRLSGANSVAYLEISSSDGILATCKVALVGGRGSAAVQIPVTAPTGNYSLIGYTSSSRGRGDLHVDAKVISVFNTSSSARVKNGVDILDADGYAAFEKPAKVSSGSVELGPVPEAGRSSSFDLAVSNRMNSGVTMSLSVYRDDMIASPCGKTIVDFPGVPFKMFDGKAEDMEGEAFHGRLFGADAEAVAADYDLLAVVAFPGYAQDVYAGRIAPDGTVSFSTGNVYGKRDMVCEIIGLDDSKDCRLFIDSPFEGVKVPGIPGLKMSEVMRTSLEDRHRALGMDLKAGIDTLVEFLPRRHSVFLTDDRCTRYHLDDYTRFPTLKETLIEITPDLRVRKDVKGRPQIQTVLEGVIKDNTAFSGNMLVLIDGVPVKDVERLLEFDAMLISDILVYPYSYSLGSAIFNGVVDFVTKQSDISSFKFDRNVVIVDWQGEAYPVAFTCVNLKPGNEDLRQTLYWHPQLSLDAGETLKVMVRTPSYSGRFKIVAEGIASDGTPFRSESVLEVR